MAISDSISLIYENAVPPRAPFCGLGALSELAEELNATRILASKTLIENKGIFHHFRALFKSPQLPKKLAELAVHTRKLAQRTQNENLFLDNEGMPLSMGRVDATYNKLLEPLINLAYILESSGRAPPRQLNIELMTLLIGKLAHVISELGEGLRSDLSYQVYQRTLHVVTRLERAEAEWRKAAKA